ncbi:unnamed protein product, partial [Dovyalis caffra]
MISPTPFISSTNSWLIPEFLISRMAHKVLRVCEGHLETWVIFSNKPTLIFTDPSVMLIRRRCPMTGRSITGFRTMLGVGMAICPTSMEPRPASRQFFSINARIPRVDGGTGGAPHERGRGKDGICLPGPWVGLLVRTFSHQKLERQISSDQLSASYMGISSVTEPRHRIGEPNRRLYVMYRTVMHMYVDKDRTSS